MSLHHMTQRLGLLVLAALSGIACQRVFSMGHVFQTTEAVPPKKCTYQPIPEAMQPECRPSSQTSLSRFSPASRHLGGVIFPRKGMPLYRGIASDQASLSLVLRAIGGDLRAQISSPFSLAISSARMGQSSPFALSKHFVSEFQSIMSRYKEKTDDLGSALGDAKLEIDHHFANLTDQDFLSKYLDYNSPDLQDFPDDLIFTSFFQSVAAFYSPRIVVFQDSQERGLDVNYWNFNKHNKWLIDGDVRDYHDSYFWGDSGEFVFAGYIPAKDIVGYQVRDSYNTADKSKQRARTPIDFAFHRYEANGETFVAAYQGNKKNGSSSDCMALHPSLHDGKLYHCSFATPQDEPVVSNDRMLHRSRPAIDVLSLMLRAPSQLGDVQRIAILRTQTA